MRESRDVKDESNEGGIQTASADAPSDAGAPRRRRRWLAPLPIGAAVSLVALFGLLGWFVDRRAKEEPEEAAVVEVEVAPGMRTEMREYVETTGTLNALPGREASFSAATAGRVTRVLVEVGDQVRAGQTLAELDRSVLAAQVRQAAAAVAQARATAAQARTVSGAPSQTLASDQIRQAEVALTQARANQTQAQSNLTRLESLFERGIAARKEVEEAQTQLAIANATVAQAQSALNAARASATRGVGEARTQASVAASGVAGAEAALGVARAELARASIRAPVGGTLTRRAINDGETIDPATPIFEVVDSSALDLVANLPARYLGRVKTGDFALVKVEPFPDREYSGGVVSVAPSIDPQTNTVAVRVRLSNERGELRAGLYATARIAVEIHAGALVVPEAAVVAEGDETFVFVVRSKDKEDEIVEKRAVVVGIRDGGRVEIKEGLQDHEAVVTTGAFGLSDGAKIKVTGKTDESRPEAGTAAAAPDEESAPHNDAPAARERRDVRRAER